MFAKLSAGFGLIAAVGTGIAIAHQESQATRLSFLAIGQGDCAVFQHAGRVVMVDAAAKLPDFDAAQRLALPELRKLGVSKIDLLILTHPDADHVGGLIAMSRRFKIGRIVAGGDFRDHPEMKGWLQRAGISDSQVTWIDGHVQATIQGATISILNPGWNPAEAENEGSLIVRFALGRGSAVLTGDAGQMVESRLSRTGEWQSQILKAGHHGSQTSTSMTWLKEVRPEWAIISCGRGNTYGHPHDDVMQRIEAAKIKTLRTDRDGTIRFRIGPKGFEPEG